MTGTVTQALLSVSDKTGIVDFARALAARGIRLLSTGGTARLLAENDVRATDVGSYTGFPEMLDGRVKTLHPKIHGGILARRDVAAHREALARHAIPTIDLVVVNLYPFRETVADPDCTLDDAIENIDIGGPSMVRAAAKNWRDVGVVIDPREYDGVLADLDAHDGALSAALRFRLMQQAFAHTAAYDGAIANWLTARDASGVVTGFPRRSITPPTSARTCATARTRTSARRCTASRRRRLRRSRRTGSCRARSFRSTTSPMPTPHGTASRHSTSRRA
jgi:phosphoribosylaminoimidazolecarboxamide formyltransferase/IMP cyclohydrolase